MRSNRWRERLRVHKVLQDAANRLTADIPDSIDIGLSDEEVMFDCVTWSSALTRQHFSGETGRRMLSPFEWRTCAEDEVMHLFGEAIDGLKDRWESAKALGLVRGRELIDLEPGKMTIDRTLLRMLDSKGIDVRRAGARIAAQTDGAWIDAHSGMMGVEMGHGSIVATHEGVGPPVIRTSLAIDRANYDGGSLLLNDRLPDTLAEASVGRVLGEIVGTGVYDLDRRLVTAVKVLGPEQNGLVGDVRTRIELAPDLVRLGDGGRAPAPKPRLSRVSGSK